ncbi:VPS9 domain protein [Paecilomyces variotii No. 5]|uniref:VPS9 domain protein n=1 Tax=Byssochlamys spectabilis (strain No. 5 / NBRC 109023) TaxID=1356009 RepID=V5FYU9_BYSSN|nr:VPS9 domain protein [Paecilomyces variotii No. 5]
MSSNSSEDVPKRPSGLHPARSFTRMESSTTANPFARTRSKTMQNMTAPESVDSDALPLPLSPEDDSGEGEPDVFEKRGSSDSENGNNAEDGDPLVESTEAGFDELPIELMSLTDRFVNSLSAKVYSTPPSIDQISDMFQEFYVRTDTHIATHISALASRLNREPSPVRLRSVKGGTTAGAEKAVDHQMLTASEVAEKRKARKLLAYKRVALEEAVERRACESIYDKIWRHKSTLDEVRDEKLRSKTAALSVVGIDLKDLGIEAFSGDEKKQEEANEWLTTARESLMRMNDEKYPLGKLHHLTAAHKAIVDTLTNLLPSSSSADEILPTLIYSLITCPPDGLNAISNLLFIQRFRSASKMDGETAYCLTNLEAAISFLENVDLSSLRADELPEGQQKTPSGSVTPASERADPFKQPKDVPSPSVTSASAAPEFSKPDTPSKDSMSATLPRPQLSVPQTQQRRLSNLFQPPSKVLGAANDAVRNTADQGLKNIGNTLDNSFNFLFGRLKEMQNQGTGQRPVLPKTLDEARRLVTSPSKLDSGTDLNEDGSIKALSTPDPVQRPTRARTEDRLLAIVGGNKTPRERSADSAQSRSSNTRNPTMPSRSQKEEATPSPTPGGSIFSSSSASTPLESMKNFGNTFNPLNHIPGMIRGFGRSATTPEAGQGTMSPAAPAPIPTAPSPADNKAKPALTTDGATDISALLSKIDPPLRRFLETEDPGDLRLRDVAELLQDYKRLATVLATLGESSN